MIICRGEKSFCFVFRVDFFQFDIIRWNFSNLSECFRLWFCLFMSTCAIVYYCFHFWAYKRLSLIPVSSSSSTETEKLKNKSTALCKKNFLQIDFIDFHFLVIFDWTCLAAYCCYTGLFFYIPVHYILAENYPIVTRIIILAEQVTTKP